MNIFSFHTLRSKCRRRSLILVFLMLGMAWSLPVESASPSKKSSAEQITASYLNATITEDVTWHGTVSIKGFLVVAPQTTLRIEPGTVIRFSATGDSRQLPRLVVRGRIQCIGTSERPILFTPAQNAANKADWGGVLLLSSEKRNQFEFCHIEGADIGFEARFSTVVARNLTIARSITGALFRDSFVTLTSSSISACDTAIEAHDSEVELKEGAITANRRGLQLFRSSVVLSSLIVSGSTQQALFAEDCRIKCNSSEFSDNVGGAQFLGGEGQIFLTRFSRNREVALHLAKARLKVSRCQIANNIRTGIKLEDDRATIWGNAIYDNAGYNLLYTGREAASLVQNWWGSKDEITILSKLSSTTGSVIFYPWLSEKPTIFP